MTEVRYVDPTTGGEKGQKPEMYSLLPVPALAAIARVYAKGASKYASNNWRRGYPWSLSYDALMRHTTQFWDGEDLDPEWDYPHLAHAGFHIMSLLTFQLEGLGTDDRFKRPD